MRNRDQSFCKQKISPYKLKSIATLSFLQNVKWKMMAIISLKLRNLGFKVFFEFDFRIVITREGGGALDIFRIRERAIGKGIYFPDIGIKNGINFHNFGIRNCYVFEAWMARPPSKSGQVHPSPL